MARQPSHLTDEDTEARKRHNLAQHQAAVEGQGELKPEAPDSQGCGGLWSDLKTPYPPEQKG